MNKDISIIIPVADEFLIINHMIERIRKSFTADRYEIIVVDGNYSGNTLKAISDNGVTKIKSPCQGRGAQMNVGARLAKGCVLLFLHADTSLPENADSLIISACFSKKVGAGAFELKINSDKPGFRLIEKMATCRSRLTRIPYGDQAIFVKKKIFYKIGEFKEIPIMEDIDLMRRIKHAGYKISFINNPVKTSARRWEKEGIVFCTIRNIVLSTMFYLGVSPKTLKKYYK